MLGAVKGKRVVELGAGIGRFTTPLAAEASSVLALDFMENLIEANRVINGAATNVTWAAGDYMVPHLQPFCCPIAVMWPFKWHSSWIPCATA